MVRNTRRSPSTRPRAGKVLAAVAVLAVLGTAAAPAQVVTSAPAPPTPEAPRARAGAIDSQLFHVTLVAAFRQESGAGGEELPAAVAKALADIKEFLPYKGYRVVDAALVRGSGEAEADLRSASGERYTASIRFRRAGGEQGETFLVDRFVLRGSRRMDELRGILEERRNDGAVAVAPLAPSPSLTASFRIDVGETVVVGSSRMDGGEEAMIVLLTAVP